MASFVVTVHQAPQTHAASMHALRFARAAYAAGHEVSQVFFYEQGVWHADAQRQAAPNEPDLSAQWLEFSAQTHTPLVLCHTVAERYGLEQTRVREGFTIGGLTELMTTLAHADRVVQFR